jgi:hypothetical protein
MTRWVVCVAQLEYNTIWGYIAEKRTLHELTIKQHGSSMAQQRYAISMNRFRWIALSRLLLGAQERWQEGLYSVAAALRLRLRKRRLPRNCCQQHRYTTRIASVCVSCFSVRTYTRSDVLGRTLRCCSSIIDTWWRPWSACRPLCGALHCCDLSQNHGSRPQTAWSFGTSSWLRISENILSARGYTSFGNRCGLHRCLLRCVRWARARICISNWKRSHTRTCSTRSNIPVSGPQSLWTSLRICHHLGRVLTQQLVRKCLRLLSGVRTVPLNIFFFATRF